MSNTPKFYGCKGGSKALSVLESLQGAAGDSQHFVVCKSEEDAKALTTDLKTLGDIDVLLIPDTETLPYDLENPHSSIRAKRNNALHSLATESGVSRILVCSMWSFTRKVAPESFWLEYQDVLGKDSIIKPDSIESRLYNFAYDKEDIEVSEPGEYVRNGSVFDIFPMGASNPIRIKFEGDRITNIHTFDIETKRNVEEIESASILPAYEYPTDEASLRRVRSFIRSNTKVDPMDDPVFAEIKETRHASGLEYFIPELVKQPVSLMRLVKGGVGGVLFVDCSEESDFYWTQACRRFDEVSKELMRVIPEPQEVWTSPERMQNEVDGKVVAVISSETTKGQEVYSSESGAERQPDLSSTAEMLEELAANSNHLLVAVSHESRIRQMEQILMLAGLESDMYGSAKEAMQSKHDVSMTLGVLSSGFRRHDGLVVISDREVFGNVVQEAESLTKRAMDFQSVQDLENLKEGDPLVHLEYGVGRFAGLQKVDLGGQEEEMLKIRYAEDVVTFVPMSELYQVTRFASLDEGKVPLDEMRSKKWLRKFDLSIKDIKQTATALVALKKARMSRRGIVFSKPGWKYHRFCNGFEFEPTPDQHKAFKDVTEDLCNPVPMDRLIVGDVGFGKTEVALRASFHAAENNQKVVVAAPTSILASQHYSTFKDRFQATGFRVCNFDELTKKQVEEVMEDDEPVILVGTHSVLRIKNNIKKVGLFIIDEEHRFGARDKEMIAMLHGSVNVLNMTATPIPRTLTLSLSGIRDISMIATAPSKRLSVRTLMAPPTDATYRDAIEREMIRGGQVYVLHNRSTSLEERAEYIRSVVPDARVRTIHGRMSDEKQREILVAFNRHEFDILVCTTVIEIGINVPRANTILIEKPELLGLSQMHQIRGRVGRSDRQGYAYIVADPESIKDNAKKRFNALIQAKRLGDGFVLANHDLEIRGAGELLGEKQSGHIHAIGFSLYSKTLIRAVNLLSEKGDISDLMSRDRKIELKMNSSGFIGTYYIEKPSMRLTFYKRLASAEYLKEIQEIEQEMTERFGNMPKVTKDLMSMTKVRLFARNLGISKAIIEDTRGYIESGNSEGRKSLHEALEEVCPDVQESGNGYRFYYPMPDTQKRYGFMIELMRTLHGMGKKAA